MFSREMQPRSPSLRSPPVASTPPSSAPAGRKHPGTQGPGSPARASRVHFSARGSFADGGMPQETARPAQRGELPGERRRARKDRTPAMAPGRPRAVASSHSAAGTQLASAELPKGEGPSHCTLRKVSHSSVFGSAGARAGDRAGTHRARTAAGSTPSPPRPSELTAKLVEVATALWGSSPAVSARPRVGTGPAGGLAGLARPHGTCRAPRSRAGSPRSRPAAQLGAGASRSPSAGDPSAPATPAGAGARFSGAETPADFSRRQARGPRVLPRRPSRALPRRPSRARRAPDPANASSVLGDKKAPSVV